MFARTRMMLAGLAALVAVGARAQPPEAARTTPEAAVQEPAVPEADKERPVTVDLKVRGEFGFETSLSDSPGKVTVVRGGGAVNVGIPVAQYAQLDVGFDYEHSNYDFHGATGFVAGTGSPFDDIDREFVSARFAQYLSREWLFFVGGRVMLSGEEGAKTGDSLEGVIYAAPRYRFSDKLSAGLGIEVYTRLEDNTQVIPLVSLDWDFAERWNLTVSGEPSITVTYAPNDHWSFSLGGVYEYRDFRLDRNGPLPGGVGRDTRIPITLAAKWNPDKRISAEAGVGVAFAQNFELLDSSGNSVADIDADASPFFMIQLGFRF